MLDTELKEMHHGRVRPRSYPPTPADGVARRYSLLRLRPRDARAAGCHPLRRDGRTPTRVAPAGAAKTRKEAAEKLTAAMADASKGITADGGPKTVGAFLTSWLETSVRGNVRKSTYDRNESLCRVHLIPALGRKKLKTLSAADVAGFCRSRLDSGCSAASVRKMHETLHKALRQAMRWGYMMKNPADDVDPPKVPRKKLPRSPVKRRVGY